MPLSEVLPSGVDPSEEEPLEAELSKMLEEELLQGLPLEELSEEVFLLEEL